MQTSYSAGNASFSRNLLRLAVPIVLQNLVTTAVSSADVIMLGFVSRLSGEPDYVYPESCLFWNFFWCHYACSPILGKAGHPYH